MTINIGGVIPTEAEKKLARDTAANIVAHDIPNGEENFVAAQMRLGLMDDYPIVLFVLAGILASREKI